MSKLRTYTRKIALVGGAAALGLTMGMSAITPASAQDTFSLAYFMSDRHPMNRAVFTPFAEKLAELSGGQLAVEQFPAGALGAGPVQQYQRALDGVADIVFGIPGYTANLFPATMLVAIPGVAPSGVAATRMLWAAQDYTSPEYSEVKMLAAWTNELAVLITRDKAVRSVADVAGMKIRAPSAADSPIIESWGAVPVQMPINETHQALTTGIVDGILVGSSALGRPWNLHEPGNFVTTNIPGSVAAFYLVMNTETWNGLTDQQKAWVDEASGFDLSMKGAEGFEAAGVRGLAAAEEAGVEIIELDAAAKQGFLDASQPAIEASLAAVESQGASGAEILEIMKAGL